MKISKYFLLFIFLLNYAQDCHEPTAHEFLETDLMKIGIPNGGDLWWNLSYGQYKIPKESIPNFCSWEGYGWEESILSDNSKLLALPIGTQVKQNIILVH